MSHDLNLQLSLLTSWLSLFVPPAWKATILTTWLQDSARIMNMSQFPSAWIVNHMTDGITVITLRIGCKFFSVLLQLQTNIKQIVLTQGLPVLSLFFSASRELSLHIMCTKYNYFESGNLLTQVKTLNLLCLMTNSYNLTSNQSYQIC